MNVGDSVKHALDHYERHEYEAATLHACLALDGTAKKLYPERKEKNRERFERMIRDHIDVFTVFASPGINLGETKFPVRIEEGKKRQPLDVLTRQVG